MCCAVLGWAGPGWAEMCLMFDDARCLQGVLVLGVLML